MKSNISLNKFDFKNLKSAYNNFLTTKKAKFDDIKHLKYVVIPENVIFYDSITYSNSDSLISKSKLRAREMTTEFTKTDSYCDCKRKCMRLFSFKKMINSVLKTVFVYKLSVKILKFKFK